MAQTVTMTMTMTVRVRGMWLAKLIVHSAVPVLRVIAMVSPSLARRIGDGICGLLTRLLMSQIRVTTP